MAALVEQASHRRGLEAPAWTRQVAPLEAPHFATSLASVRLHLLRSSPIPFKRRNIFIDTALGGRV